MGILRSQRWWFVAIAVSLGTGCGTDTQPSARQPSAHEKQKPNAQAATPTPSDTKATVAQVAPPIQSDATPPKDTPEPPKKSEVIKVKLPEHALKAAYVLALYPNDELVRIERSEPVYLAIISRSGLDRKWRVEAIEALAKLRKTSIVAQLIAAIAYVDENDQVEDPKESAEDEVVADFGEEEQKDFTVLNELAEMLLASDQAALAKEREAIQEFIGSATNARARQIAFAALVAADASTDKAWQHAEENSQAVDLLGGLPLVPSAKLRASLFDKARQQLEQAFEDEARDACLAALASMEGREADAFALMAAKVDDQLARPAAINALIAVKNKDAWPKDKLAPLADVLVNFVKELPTEDRNAPAGKSAVKLARELASRLPKADGKRIRDALGDLVVRRIELGTIDKQMMYDKMVLVVRAGKPVQIVLTNLDSMPHNMVFLRPKEQTLAAMKPAMEKVALATEAMVNMAGAGVATFVPPLEAVIASSKMVSSNEQDEFTFTAPEKPGTYPFICTFPGHWTKMYGELVVVDDVDAYLAANPSLPSAEKLLGLRGIIKVYPPEEVLAFLAPVKSGRSFEQGKKVFESTANCMSCHRMKGKGGMIGPELTEVSKKFKPHEIAREMADPSKVINEKYASVMISFGGRTYQGVIVEESETEWKLKPVEKLLIKCEPTIVSKVEFKEEKEDGEDVVFKKLDTSPMPEGVLNTLYEEEIKDLFAYVLSGGDPKHPVFAKP